MLQTCRVTANFLQCYGDKTKNRMNISEYIQIFPNISEYFTMIYRLKSTDNYKHVHETSQNTFNTSTDNTSTLQSTLQLTSIIMAIVLRTISPITTPSKRFDSINTHKWYCSVFVL